MKIDTNILNLAIKKYLGQKYISKQYLVTYLQKKYLLTE